MKSVKIALRLGSVIMFLHAVGHTIGIATWKNADSKVPHEVIQSMVDANFDFNGAGGNMAQFYDGLGYASTIALILSSVLLWLVATETDNPRFSVKVLVPITVFLLLLAMDEIIYFFPLAAAFSFVAAVLSVFAIVKLNAQDPLR